jgi:deoxyadenosine/deoxycytidine kinase
MRISIEGNIGAGKSTALTALQEAFPKVSCYPEPVEEWGDLLDLYYADKKTWALPFSLKVLLSFRTQRSKKTPSCFVERSPLSCKHVFTQMLLNDGIMNSRQWEIFGEFHEIIGWKPDVIVYIDTPPALCHTRATARGRACERAIDIQFLKRVEFYYETMLKTAAEGVQVIRIDGSVPPAQLAEAVVRAVRRILSNCS